MSMEDLDATGFWPWLLFTMIAVVLITIVVCLLNKLVKWLLRDRKKLEPVRVIGERELAAMFLNAPNNPLWLATHAALDLQVQEELDECLEETLTDQQLRHRTGGVAALLRFKANLQDREQEARRTETQDKAADEQG